MSLLHARQRSSARMRPESVSAQPLPLTLAAPGECAEVLEIRLHGDEKQRLHELGMTPGSHIRVIKTDPANGLIVAVRHDARLALNRSTAHHIIVRLSR